MVGELGTGASRRSPRCCKGLWAIDWSIQKLRPCQPGRRRLSDRRGPTSPRRRGAASSPIRRPGLSRSMSIGMGWSRDAYGDAPVSERERSPTANITSHDLLCDSISFFGHRDSFWYVSTTCLSAEEAGWARGTVSGLTPCRRRVSRGIDCAPANLLYQRS
jgi:hypothetical protein